MRAQLPVFTLLALVVSSDPAMAQITEPVETVVLTRAARTRATYFSASLVILDGTHNICVKDTMTDGEASDETNQFRWVLQLSTDDFVTLIPGSGTRADWHGGTHFDKDVQAIVPNHIRQCWGNSALMSGQYVGMRARLLVDLSVNTNVGFRLRLNPEGFARPD